MAWRYRVLAALVDGGLFVSIYYLCVKWWNLSPVPSAGPFLLYTAVFGAVWLLQNRFLGGSVGRLIWYRMRSEGKVTPSVLATATFLTILCTAASFWCVRDALWKHPLMARAEVWNLAPFAPGHPAEQRNWVQLPFFYSIGAWPRTFLGNPVFHLLPYEKGPPDQFTGRIVARWHLPDIRVVIEGPRTETRGEKPEILRECFTAPTLTGPGWDCIRLRDQAIGRHFREMRGQVVPKTWVIRWFEVENPALPPDLRPRGIYLRAQGDQKVQERYVLVNALGAHQAVVLHRREDPEGVSAQDVLEKIIRSMQVADGLGPGRAVANTLLSRTTTAQLEQVEDTLVFIRKLAEIQAILLAKISVEPGAYEAYYHLGGIALLLSKHIVQMRTQRTHVLNPQLLSALDEWSATARPLIQSTYRYAQDIDPTHPLQGKFQNIWIEGKKL